MYYGNSILFERVSLCTGLTYYKAVLLLEYSCYLFHSTIQYLGFGLSGSNSMTSMFQADATIAWIDNNGMAQAQDYYLSNYVQVSVVHVPMHINIQYNFYLFHPLLS